MVQAFSPVLFPPIVLATDGSSGALQAQKVACAIAQTLLPVPLNNGLANSEETFSNAAPTNLPSTNLPSTNPPPAKPAGLVVLSVLPRQRLATAQKIGQTLRSAGKANRETNQLATLGTGDRAVPDSATATANGASHPPGSPDSLAALIKPDLPEQMPVELVVRMGRPAVEILSYAHTVEAGLIVVGHRGRGGMRELLLGSVSTAIARYAPCSVLVARNSISRPGSPSFHPEATEAVLQIPPIQHLLVVVSRAAASQWAIATAHQLLSLGVQQVTLLYICPPLNANHLFGPVAVQTPSWQLEQSLQEAQREQGHDLLAHAQAAFADTTIPIQPLARIGDPGPIICQIAAEQQVDLILLGSDSRRRSLLSHLQVRRHTQPTAKPAKPPRGILRNTRLSVTDDYVIHYAPCPVLLCRPRQD